MFEEVLAEQNPHWQGDFYDQGVERKCFANILKYLNVPHVISITGVRRGGKSTLLKQTMNYLMQHEKVAARNVLFVNLEHPYFSRYSDDVRYLERLFDDYITLVSPQGKIYCFLDEVQFFRRWPVFVKTHYEQKNMKFFITGSNSFLMSRDLLTLLSGRTLPIEVYPLSFAEYLQAQVIDLDPVSLHARKHEVRRLLDRFLRFGAFPEIALLPEEHVAYDILASYAKTILYQDVASRLGLKKPLDLERLFHYLVSNVGAPFSYASLDPLFALSDKTIKEYIQALADAYLLFEVDRFSFSLKRQIRSPKKVYAIDSGMINAVSFKFSENRGRLFENAVYLELKRRNKEVYFYKTSADYEVDFLIKEKEVIGLVQVCTDWNDKVEAREVRALVEAAKELGLTSGLLITSDFNREWTVDAVHITALSIDQFLARC